MNPEGVGAPGFLQGGGETGVLMRALDWASTPLGPPMAWPSALKTAVSLMLGARQPVYVAWGPQLTSLYNDGYLPIVGTKHPHGFGKPFAELWSEIWNDFRPIVEATMAGEAQHFVDLPIALAGRPDLPVGYFTFSYTALRDDTGEIAGFYCAATETTDKVLAEGRQAAERKRQHLMLRQMPGFVALLHGPEHRYEYVNEAYVALSGPRDILGRTVRDAFPELEGQGFYELLDQVFATGRPFMANTLAVRLSQDGGSERFIDLLYEPTRDEAGAITGIFVGGYDVTERVRVETALRESEARYRQIVESADDVAIVTLDEHGVITGWNRGAERIVGHTRKEAIGQTLGLFFTSEDENAGVPEAEMARARRQERAVEERWQRRRDGSQFWSAGVMMPLDGGGGFLRMFRDRTPEHAADARLRESEERYRTLFENISAAFCVVEVIFDDSGSPIDHRFVEINPAFERHSGLKNALGRRAREVLPEHEQHWFDTYGRIAITGEPARFENGSQALGRWFDVHALRVGAPEQRRVGILFNDITERKKTEDRLRDLNETLERRVAEGLSERKLLADLVEGTDAFVQVADPNYRWLAINRSAVNEFERIYGVRPRVGASMLDLLAHKPEHRDAVKAAWERALAGQAFTEVGEFGDAERDRRSYEMKYNVLRDASGALIGAYQFVYDVTDRVREQKRLADAEEALRQSQKMEMVGQLTGGIAHDFNNLLMAVLTNLDLLRKHAFVDSRAARLIDGAEQGAKRGAALTQRLLAFARRQSLEVEPTDIGALVDGMRDLLLKSVGSGIGLEVLLGDGLPMALVDQNQVEMALLNLVVNARDAMPDGGTVTVSVDAVSLTTERELKEGRYIRLRVVDTGRGMDEATLQRAIEPFFSTKELGKGTGLGLSMIDGLAKQLNGALQLASKPGEGTTANLYLPVTTLEAPTRESKRSVDRDAANARRSRILVVDDDVLIAMSTVGMLEDLGHEVVEVYSGASALDALKTDPAIDLVITDFSMPGMNGAQLAEAARQLIPDLPILLATGYAEIPQGVSIDLPRLGKPYSQDELAREIRRLLHGAAQPSAAAPT